LTGADIGVIAPYAAQVSLLRRLLGRDAGYADRFAATLGPHRATQTTRVEVSTVDGFEGREKEVIIFSTVRNNPGGQLGFLADRRRLNVGLTRAKRGLFIVGSLQTLRAGRVSRQVVGDDLAASGGELQGVEAWRRYAEFLTRQQAVVRLNGRALADMLYGNLPTDYRQNYTRERGSYE
jgi:superfamily I DNA and/or RNA helicase